MISDSAKELIAFVQDLFDLSYEETIKALEEVITYLLMISDSAKEFIAFVQDFFDLSYEETIKALEEVITYLEELKGE